MHPSSVHKEGNTTRVAWIRDFLGTVTVHTHLSLEDKIERLQRRLGGQPLRFDEQLNRVAEVQAKEEERLMQEFQRKQEEIKAKERVDLQDQELLRRYNEEQEKEKERIAAAKRAVEEKIRREKEEALAKIRAEEERVRMEEERKKREEQLKKAEEEAKKAKEAQEKKEKAEAEQRNKLLKEMQDRLN
jgi:membrane protein involved in colicin uptake